MRKFMQLCWKLILVGGWAPLSVFAIHIFIGKAIHAYRLWPSIDVPMHFAGGLAFAFFVSRCFQELPRYGVQRSRSVILELLLIGSLTATAAVFWEFAEFTLDQLFSSNVQVGLQNTMKDLALGILGSVSFILVRAWQLRVGHSELRELTIDWVRGRTA